MADHIIHKQQVLLNVGKIDLATEFQSCVSELFANQLSDTLEALFDKICLPGEVVRLDSIKIDLGVLNAENFEREFKSRFITEIEKEVVKRKQEIDVAAKKVTKEGKDVILPDTQALRESFIYFLQFGTLPWYCAYKVLVDWEKQILENFSTGDWQFFLQWIESNRVNEVISKRLVMQFSDAFLAEIISKANPSNPDPIEKIYSDLLILISQPVVERQASFRTDIWKLFLEYFLYKKEKLAPAFITIQLFETLSNDKLNPIFSAVEEGKIRVETKSINSILLNLIQLIREENNQQGVESNNGVSIDGNKKKFTALLDKYKNRRARLASLLSGELANKENIDVVDVIKEQHSEENSSGYYKQNKTLKSVTPEDVLYVLNSGIIILHPFLETYFTELGLMANKRFLSDEANARAILLLHYLATGSTDIAEFELALQKIICGYELEETLPSQLQLSEREREESDKLLKTVTDYWPPLKNTSAQGLQSSFLQRDGKLTLKDSGWFLVVEQKTIDILLGKLPWGFSTIRLPWMKEVINVEWC